MRFEIKNIVERNTGNSKQVVQLNGSVHKYRNEGVHNSDDFNANDAISTIEKICNDYEIDPQRTGINGLEFGVNVVLPFPVKLLLDNLISYNGQPFKSELKKGMRFYKCDKTQFSVKVYDKGLQNKLPINLLRFEVSADKMQFFKWCKIPIVWLSDLLNPDIYPRLAEILVTTFNDILFNDNRIDIKTLTATEQTIYFRGSNPNTWTGASKTEKEKKERQRFRKKFLDLLNRHRQEEDFREITLNLIRNKSLELSRPYQVSEPTLPTFETPENGVIVPILYFKDRVRKGHTGNSKDFGLKKLKLCSGCGKPLAENQKTYHSIECQRRKFERNRRSNPRNDAVRKFGDLENNYQLF